MKLRAINAEHIRRLSDEDFKALALPLIRESCKREDIDIDLLCKTLHPRTEVLLEIPEQVDFIDELPEYSLDLYEHKKMKTNKENSKEMLIKMLPVLEGLSDFSFDSIHEALFKLIAELEVKNGLVLWPLRVAVSGKQFTPGGGIEIAAIIGKDETIKRVKKAIELL